MADVTIDRTHYITLIDLAGENLGSITAHEIVRSGRFIHPGDPLGSILASAWLTDPDLPMLAMIAYVAEVRAVCEQEGTTAPSLAAIFDALPLAYNEARYPGVDFDDLTKRLRHDVPRVLG